MREEEDDDDSGWEIRSGGSYGYMPCELLFRLGDSLTSKTDGKHASLSL